VSPATTHSAAVLHSCRGPASKYSAPISPNVSGHGGIWQDVVPISMPPQQETGPPLLLHQAWHVVVGLVMTQQISPLAQSAALVHPCETTLDSAASRGATEASAGVSSVGRSGLTSMVCVFGPLLPELHAPTTMASTATALPVRDIAKR
jgi:hypothetical protein